MLNKIFGRFFGQKRFKDKLLSKIVALSLVLFQAVFLLILLDREIFNVGAQTAGSSYNSIIFTNSTETIISGEYIIEAKIFDTILPERMYLYINGMGTSTSVQMEKQTNNSFRYIWNTLKFANGLYTIKAHAFSNTVINSDQITKQINNPEVSFKINILSPINTTVEKGDINLKIATNYPNISQINGRLISSSSTEYPSFVPKLVSGFYVHTIPSVGLSNGTYKLYIYAKLTTGQEANNFSEFLLQKFSSTAENTVTSNNQVVNEPTATSGDQQIVQPTAEQAESKPLTSTTTAPETPLTTSNQVASATASPENNEIYKTAQDTQEPSAESISLIFSGSFPQTISGKKIFNVIATKPVEKVDFFVHGSSSKKFESNFYNNTYSFTWPTNDFPNGKYKLEARAMLNNAVVATNFVDVIIDNPTIKPLDRPISQNETTGSNSTTPINPTPTTTEPTSNNGEKIIPDECQKINITNFEDCQVFLNLDPLCKQKEIKTPYQCNNYLNLNAKCKELNLNEIECNDFLKLPLDCRNNSKTTLADCQKYLYSKSLPLSCIQKNLTDHEKCNEYLTLLSLPSVCAEAEITTKEKCRAFLENKQLAAECKNANINNEKDCDAFLLQAEQKLKCASLGINNMEQCQFYFQNKNLNPDCIKIGIKNQSDCDALLLKNSSKKLCETAGITSEKECANYIYNKFQPEIICGSFNKWDCQNIIETKFLGEIANKQLKFNELKDSLDSALNKKLSVNDISANLNTAKTLLPLKNNPNIKILRLSNKILLDNKNHLTQTAPAAIIIDSDGDGLPDDTEKRIGTNPNNTDSDNDGFSDSEEVKRNFNPMGTGMLASKLDSFDQAITQEAVLEQPKTTGEISNTFVVNEFVNSNDNKSYKISGKADPNIVVTLYIYSDMPLLVTARTDEFGNWEYDLKESLIDGEHEIYVAINDNTGRIAKKSNPLNFFIKEAKAVSINDFVSSAPKNAPTKTESMLNFYFIISLIVVVSGILLFIIVILLHKNKKDSETNI